MIECKHYINGSCKVATELAKSELPIAAHESTCKACVGMSNPMGVNKATCGLAVHALVASGGFDSQIHENLLSCVGAAAGPSSTSVINKPGSALKNILATIGISEPDSCYCEQYAKQMDDWGYVGCLYRRSEIIDHLNEQSVSWFDMIKVAFAGYLTTGALVDEALKRSHPDAEDKS
jgi:hypothetical protein